MLFFLLLWKFLIFNKSNLEMYSFVASSSHDIAMVRWVQNPEAAVGRGYSQGHEGF